MTDRERLIELILNVKSDDFRGVSVEQMADYLLEDGVIVPPVKIGDTVYTNCSMQGWYLRSKDRPYKAKVVYMGINGTKNYMNVVYEKNECMLSFDFDQIGKTVFLTREEAEKALKEREENT